MAIVPYQAQQHLSVLPAAVRTAVGGYQTLTQVVRAVKKTAWFLNKSNNVRKQIISSLSSGGSSPNVAPVAMNTRIAPRAPRYRSGKASGSMIISHREYLGEVTGSTTFGVTSRQVNPGMSTTFPWLSTIANSYEQYKILSMRFTYVNIAATSERGRVTMAFDYDVLDEVPPSKYELFQVSGATEGSLWSPLEMSIKPSVKLFTRPGLITGTDLKTYDHGQLLVGVSNAADTAVKGEIFVEYAIELFTPQPAKCNGTEFNFTGTLIATTPYTGTYTQKGTLPVTITSDNQGFAFPNPGRYLISALFSSTGAIVPGNLIYSTTGTTLAAGSANNGVQTSCGLYRIEVTSPNQEFRVRPQLSYNSADTKIEIAYSNGF